MIKKSTKRTCDSAMLEKIMMRAKAPDETPRYCMILQCFLTTAQIDDDICLDDCLATFSFSMADELNAVLRGDGGLNVALEVRNKVSQERVAIEARKMLALHGARPLHALSLLHEYGLRDCVFGLTWTEEQWHAALSGAQRVLHAHTRGDQRQACAQHVALLAHLLLASLPLLVHAEEVAHLRGLAQAMSQDEDNVERTFKFAANMILMFEAIQSRIV